MGIPFQRKCRVFVERMHSVLVSAEKELGLALARARKNADLLYYRGLLRLSQCRYSEALECLSKCIKYADESTARDYFAKGFCEACLKRYKEAVETLDVAIRLDSSLLDAHLTKGKCLYLLGDVKSALECCQELTARSKDDPLVHIHGGNLLMETGAVDDAVKAFVNANEVQESNVAYYQQAKVIYDNQ